MSTSDIVLASVTAGARLPYGIGSTLRLKVIVLVLDLDGRAATGVFAVTDPAKLAHLHR
ncbi:hypothetical protein GCM10029992_45710 [Glycomyces albus]